MRSRWKARVDEEGVLQAVRGGDADPLTVLKGAVAPVRREQVARDRIEQDARGDLALLLGGEQYGPDRDMPREVLGAVDREEP